MRSAFPLRMLVEKKIFFTQRLPEWIDLRLIQFNHHFINTHCASIQDVTKSRFDTSVTLFLQRRIQRW